MFAFKEVHGEDFIADSPVWNHGGNGRFANVCHLDSLFLSNREALYKAVCKTVCGSIHHPNKDQSAKRLMFEPVRVPGDGRCGWRAILAAQNIEAHRSVARTTRTSVHTT